MHSRKLAVFLVSIQLCADAHWGVVAIRNQCAAGDGDGEISSPGNWSWGYSFLSSPPAVILRNVKEEMKEAMPPVTIILVYQAPQWMDGNFHRLKLQQNGYSSGFYVLSSMHIASETEFSRLRSSTFDTHDFIRATARVRKH